MKLLLDQNVSRKLVERLNELFPGTEHVSSALSEAVDDATVWSYAKSNGFTIVTKDDDFEQRSVLFGHPPKVIRIRLGNCTTSEIEELLSNYRHSIVTFHSDDEKSYLPLP